jgi:hypothetical protein
MPTSQEPLNEPTGPTETSPEPLSSEAGNAPRNDAGSPVVSGSRWVDYDTHELLQMISDLEDERRWARLREGVLWAILLHAAIILTVLLLPRYFFVPRVVEPKLLHRDNEWTYMDTPRLPVHPQLQKPVLTPPKPPVIDKQTLAEMNKPQPPAPAPAPEPAPTPKSETPPAPVPPAPQAQSEAPRPQAVPARPNFAMGSSNPMDQLRDAMKGAARNPGQGSASMGSRGLPMHPGAGAGGIEILSDTQGVDFNSWIQKWHYETMRTWDPLIPDEVNAPILKKGQVLIRFKVLPNGRLMENSVSMEGRSGDVALDRAAWGALTGSNYPPLPRDFHGPYLELRALFMYNMEPGR